jgi:hypothetical protein
MDATNLYHVLANAQSAGLSMREAELAANTMTRTPGEWQASFIFALNRGQPQRALQIMDAIKEDAFGQKRIADYTIIATALLGGIDSSNANAAIERRRAVLEDSQVPGAQKAWALCMVTAWRLARGDPVDVTEKAAEVRALASDKQTPSPNGLLCADLLVVQSAVGKKDSDADARLATLDSVAATAPPVHPLMLHILNTQLALLFQQRGNDRAALYALQRRMFYLYTLQELLGPTYLMRARLAAKLGERDAAITDYRRYIALMEAAEPAQRVLLDDARRELQQLSRDR